MDTCLRLGTRGSPLALAQAAGIADSLRQAGAVVELVEVHSPADGDARPITQFSQRGVFTNQLQCQLLQSAVDLAVHSLKDLPTRTVPGLELAAVPLRGSPWDVLVSRSGCQLAHLPAGSRIGTGSRRRRAQLASLRPDLLVVDLQGNVDSRLKRVQSGDLEGIILAEAGLVRLGLRHLVTEVLTPDQMMPAVGQGALAIETRASDPTTHPWVQHLEDWPTRLAVTAERSLLRHLHGGCLAPVGAWALLDHNHQLSLAASVHALDGTRSLRAQRTCQVDTESAKSRGQAEQLGEAVAAELSDRGAAELLADARGT